jgi:hypothetical protein
MDGKEGRRIFKNNIFYGANPPKSCGLEKVKNFKNEQ